DRLLDRGARKIVRRRAVWTNHADGAPWPKVARQLGAGGVVAKSPEVAPRLGLENIDFHRFPHRLLAAAIGPGRGAPRALPGSTFALAGAWINPSRMACFRASLRARRIASDFSRVAFSEGFS